MKTTIHFIQKLVLPGAAVCAVAALSAAQTHAAEVGNFDGSSRSWNSSSMSTVKASAINAGHTVEADESLSAANLANDTHLIIGEPTTTPSAGQLSDLQNWVTAGGILLMFADSANTGLPALNNIAAGIGSSLSWSGSVDSGATLAGGNFATTGGPFNIVGQSLDTSPGTPVVSGGTQLAGDYIRYEQLGSGYIFAFADRSDHDVFNPNSSTVNGQLFLNILAGSGGSNNGVPDSGAGTAALLLVAAGAIATAKMRSVR